MLETIKIKADTDIGYMVINLVEYDQKIHRAYDIESNLAGIKNEPILIGSDVSVKKSRSKKADT